MKDKLELRKKINKNRPKFSATDYYKHAEVKDKWKKPKGFHNKMRLQRHGKAAIVKPGYRGPVQVRGLDKSGLMPILVHNVKELELVDVKTQGVIVASCGQRKRQLILEAAKAKSLKVINVKDVDAEVKKITSALILRKQAKKDAAKAKEAAKPKVKAKETKDKKPAVAEQTTETPTIKEEQIKEAQKRLTKRD